MSSWPWKWQRKKTSIIDEKSIKENKLEDNDEYKPNEAEHEAKIEDISFQNIVMRSYLMYCEIVLLT